MRRMMMIFTVMAALLAACAGGGDANIEPAVESGEEAEVPALEPAAPISGEEYPAPGESGYPISPVAADLPTGYPEMTVVAPSGEVDPSDLTPVTPDAELQVMPSPGRPTGRPTTSSPQLGLMLEAVAINLNAQTDIPVDEIRVISAEPMVWPNGGLGCPSYEIAYIEVQVEGMLITLEAAGQTYNYHTDGLNRFVLCKNGEPVSSGVVPQR